jgi:hypothetical protein
MIPKEGGNTFRGSLFSNFTYDKWHGNNLDQDLKDRGLQSVGKIKKIWDFNPTIGGPLKKDALWFHFAYRNWGVNRTVPGSFSEIDPTQPSLDDSHIYSAVLRLTWQIDQKNKLGVHYDRNVKFRGHWGLASTVSEEAAAIEDMPQSYNASVKWTATLTNHLLAQAGLGIYTQQYREIYEPELPGAPGQTSRTFPITSTRYDPFFANLDQSTSFYRGAFRDGNILHISGVRNYVGSLSYVTGSQSLKAGMQFQDGISRQSDQYHGDMEIRWNGGRPSQALLRASPRYAVENTSDLGLYIDERWTIRRLTLSGGLRYDYFNGSAPDQWSAPGTWIGARLTTAVNHIPLWRDINPRLGVAWDLFGNAKTALKFTTGRYVDQAVAGPTRALNPMRLIAATDTRSWLSDTNGNLIPDPSELGPTSNARFGTVVQSVRFDPKYIDGSGTRPGHWDYALSLQHELRPGLGVSATYARVRIFNTLLPAARTNGLGGGPDNTFWTPADFDAFTFVVPDDPRLPADIRGKTVTGLYVIQDAKRPLVDNYRSFAKNYGDQSEIYNGADVNVNWRIRNGGTLGGGMTWGEAHINDCFVVDDPSQSRFCDRNVDPNSGLVRGGLQVKLLGAYPLFAGVQLSGSFQSVRGPEITAAWTSRDFNGTIQFPNSTRTSLGATPTITAQLIEPGTLYDDRLYQMDLRGSRTFGRGNTRLRLMVDLYNVFNNNAVLTRAAFGGADTYGPAWGRPVSILEARLFKVGAQIDF